ncbi:MAG: uncharacterized protein QOG80_2812 [Pseudonocardiales bacterium]|jgi:hypothetical protein|nr:uncharacterized protein [Pseudonocardiales bacterium]
MSIDLLIPVLLTTVVTFALVQSLFGVGLLLFGTPTLLLAGLPFNAVLAYLLPCSIAVSALQIVDGGGLTLEPIRKKFLFYTAPAVLVATCAVLMFGSVHQLRAAVGVVLLATAATRVSRLRVVVVRNVQNHIRPLLIGLGVVHGLSNLGGGLLSVIVGSSYTDKNDIRRHIAFAYGLMACLQLIVVFTTAKPRIDWLLWPILPALAAACYLLIGRTAFRRVGAKPFQVGLTGMIAGYGMLLVATP